MYNVSYSIPREKRQPRFVISDYFVDGIVLVKQTPKVRDKIIRLILNIFTARIHAYR